MHKRPRAGIKLRRKFSFPGEGEGQFRDFPGKLEILSSTTPHTPLPQKSLNFR